MKIKYTIFLLLFTIGSLAVNAQKTMSDYSFVQVPKSFEFLRSADQYQLNSMTRFFFNKYGFNAFFEEELPNVRRCDGLYAEVLGSPGFIYTKITVVVKDCEGNELFRSVEGRSKYKEYKKAYQDATRKAFFSFEGLGVNQKNFVKNASNIDEEKSKEMEEVIQEASLVSKKTKTEKNYNLPTSKFSNYVKGSDSFLLRKSSEGYSLYQEEKGLGDDLKYLGKIVNREEGLFFIDAEETQHKAIFGENQTLILVFPDRNAEFVLVKN